MAIPTGYTHINPFIVSDDLNGLIQFLNEVFDAIERPWVRTIDDDGLLVHAEVQVGEASILLGERKPDWPYTPALIQIYVPDVQITLDRAVARGGEIITVPTEFFGQTFSRMRDPWGNGWWIYNIPSDEPDPTIDESGMPVDWSDDAGEEWESTPEMDYIHATMSTMFTGPHDPRGAAGTVDA